MMDTSPIMMGFYGNYFFPCKLYNKVYINNTCNILLRTVLYNVSQILYKVFRENGIGQLLKRLILQDCVLLFLKY